MQTDGFLGDSHQDSREDITDVYQIYCDLLNNFIFYAQEFSDFTRSGIDQGQKFNHEDFSDLLGMGVAKIAKCDKCQSDFPTQRAFIAHKSKCHAKKPPGPSMKAEKVKNPVIRKEDLVKSPGSPAIMNSWIKGNTRSNEIGRVLNATKRQDTPTPSSSASAATPTTRTNSLNTSVSLLDGIEVETPNAASPLLSTVRMFPPVLEATPTGDSLDSWVVSQPESSKRGRERYDGEARSGHEKRPDEKNTPENIRAQRNIESELSVVQESQDTQDVIEMEFDSQEVNTVEWNNQGQQQQQPEDLSAFGTLDPDALLSHAEEEWITNDTVDFIPDPKETLDETESQNRILEAEVRETEYEGNQLKQAIIDDLRAKLDDAISEKSDYWERIMRLETQVEDLEADLTQMNSLNSQASTQPTADAKELEDKLSIAEAKVRSLTDIIATKEAEIQHMKDESLNMVMSATKQVENMKLQADLQIGEKLRAIEGKKREEVERLRAINTRAISDLKKSREANNETTELKTALVKMESERDNEKFKADKANDTLAKMETILRDSQAIRAQQDQRIKDLETRNKIQARELPCNRGDSCDFGCGRNHHCGSGRNRSRNRNQRRSRGSSEGDTPQQTPTLDNLANAAGCSNEAMQQVVNSVNQPSLPPALPTIDPRIPPHPRAGGNNKKGKNDSKWRTRLCADFNYAKCCPRGYECRNAHELVPARDMALMSQGNANIRPSVAQIRPNVNPKGKIPTPVFHPDHPMAKALPQLLQGQGPGQVQQQRVISTNAAGNSNGQRQGAPSVQPAKPQAHQAPRGQVGTQVTLQPRPRSFAEAASGTAVARQIVSESMSQISSDSARIQAVVDPVWKAKIDSALSNLRQVTSTSAMPPPQSQSPRTPSSMTPSSARQTQTPSSSGPGSRN